MSLDSLEQAIDYSFQSKALLEQALIHSSYANEHRKTHKDCNERLEFLGDAVLELSASRYLYDHFPGEPEGALSKKRAAAVCEPSLAACARRFQLSRYLLLGRGELLGGGAQRDSILSDAFEALIGAIYLDGGFEEACSFVHRFVMPEMTEHPRYEDTKTELQEVAQAMGINRISYELIGEKGPEHDKTFTVRILLEDIPGEIGSGHSKKAAEQTAAAAALQRLKGRR